MNEIKLVYHGVVYSKKNSKRIVVNRRTFRPIIISNRNAKNQERAMAWDFKTQAEIENWPSLYETDEQRSAHQYRIEIEIWQKDLRRRDLDNQATAILDGLVASGVIIDDSCDMVQKMSVEYKGVDRDDPRAEIKITEITWTI